MASPPAVVRILTIQKTKMTSGTLAATGAGKNRRTTGTVPLAYRLPFDEREAVAARTSVSSMDLVTSFPVNRSTSESLEAKRFKSR